MRHQGKIAIVTGAAAGMGFAISRRLARDGAQVMLADRDAERGRASAAKLAEEGLPARFTECDVGDSAQIEAAIAETEKNFGTADILVNNAAIYGAKDFMSVTEEDFDQVIRVNLKSVFVATQAVSRRLIAAKKPGAIVNISSVNCKITAGIATAYTASKGGVSAFTAAAALALADEGIRINAIGPGTIATDMATAIRDNPEALANALARTPLRRLGQPEEIASVASFLASDDASYMTGQTIFVDGGRTALGIVMPAPKPRS
ncbi:SDR family NAD(P)-dependent oxidoreductase (plasmid) [Mesorhizobium sp. ORM8.1]